MSNTLTPYDDRKCPIYDKVIDRNFVMKQPCVFRDYFNCLLYLNQKRSFLIMGRQRKFIMIVNTEILNKES